MIVGSSLVGRALVAVAVLVVAGCSSSGGDERGGIEGNAAPAAVERLADAPSPLFWDVSPDGQWISYLDGGDVLCLLATARNEAEEPGSERCVEVPLRRSRLARWAPDSSRVVVAPDAIVSFSGGPLAVVDIGGVVTEIAPPEEDDNPIGSAFDLDFVDADTIRYIAVDDGEPPSVQLWTIDLDGEAQELWANLQPPTSSERAPAPRLGLVISDDDTILSVRGPSGLEPGLWSADRDGQLTQLLAAGREIRPSGPMAIDAVGTVTLVADVDRLAEQGSRNVEGDFFWLLDDGVATVVPDRGLYRSVQAALSPDGRHVAVLERYHGVDENGEDDPAGRLELDDPQNIRIAIATTESLLAGQPEWFDLSGFASIGSSADLDGLVSGIVWAGPDELLLELVDGLFAVSVETAG